MLSRGDQYLSSTFSRIQYIISAIENTKADWSFGLEKAQFLTGEL